LKLLFAKGRRWDYRRRTNRAFSFGLDWTERLLLASGVTGLKLDNGTVFSDASVGVSEMVRVLLLVESLDEATVFK
jgi:hypothetical protein